MPLINIIFNCEEAASQAVFHTHAHVVPRFKNDGHKWWSQGSYNEGEAEEVAKRIKDFETDTRREFEHVSKELS